VGICLIATLGVPEDARSPWFWHRVFWAEILAFLVWATAYLFVGASSGRDRHGLFALLPAAKISILLYAGTSFAAMMIHSLMEATPFGDRVHILFQIIMAVAVLATVMLLGVVAGSASTDRDEGVTVSFASECALVQRQELRLRQFPMNRVWNDLRASLKALRETIETALPTSFPPSSLPQAIRLRDDVTRTCEQLFEHSDPTDAQLGEILSRLNQFKADAASLSKSQVVSGR
jgi:hypothetical protein